MADMTPEELQALYAWVDEVPLSRQKKSISRDFSDGVLAAEVVGHFLPKLVDLHNYSPTSATPQKLENWRTLNRKVLTHLNFQLPDDIMQSVATSKPGVIEFILSTLRIKIERYLENRAALREASRQEPFMPESFGNSYPSAASYNPSELVSDYGNDGVHVHNPQDSLRHPPPIVPEMSRGSGYPMNFAPQFNSSLVSHPPHQPHQPRQQAFPLATTTATSTEAAAASTHPPPHSTALANANPRTLMPSRIPKPPHNPKANGLQRQQRQQVPTDNERGSLPPINTGLTAMTTNARANSYPSTKPQQLQKPLLNRRNTYGATRPAHNLAANMAVQRESLTVAGLKIRLAERDQKLLEAQEYTQLLQMKVTRLEHLVQIKDMKIAELARQLEMQAKHSFHPR